MEIISKSTKSSPPISVICSVYGQAHYLNHAIRSILNQSFKDFEFIIVDDHSQDNSIDVINQFKDNRIILIKNNQRLGLTKNLNQALKIAKGKFIARIDADDIAYKNRLETQYIFLINNPEIAGCGCWAIIINNENKKIGEKKMLCDYQDIKKNIIKFNPFIHSSLMIRKEIYHANDNYNNKFLLAQDYDLLLKIVKKNKIINIPKYLISYRQNPYGLSYKKMKKSLFYALKARYYAITKYHYPKWNILYLIKPLFSYLIPVNFKMAILKKRYKL